MPDRITVAGPVKELLATSLTGRRLVSVKYAVSCWMTAASTMPMRTAPMASQRGLNVLTLMPTRAPESPVRTTPLSWAIVAGRKTKAAMITRTAEMAAEMKKPRLMALMPDRSPVRGDTAKMPTTAVTTPMAGTTSGNTNPRSPNAALPRIRAATRVTA